MKTMKLITIFLFLVLSVTGYSQIVIDTVETGQYYVLDFSSESEVHKATRPTKIRSKSGVIVADTVFYKPANAPNDTIYTLMAAAANHGFAAILFERGSVIDTSIIVSQDSLLFGNYDLGAKLVISGFTTITGWTQENDTVYSKVITADAQTNMVTIDGVNTGMGRTPNAGTYLTYESFTTNTAIVDNQLAASPDWDDAEVVVRKSAWRWDRGLITNHTGTSITYTDLGSGQAATANYGYFIQNDLRTLDQFGEWYHDTATGKFYMYFGAEDPDDYMVKVATKTHLINNTGTGSNAYDYITVKNLQLEGAINCGVYLGDRATYNTVQNCDISFCGENGVQMNYLASFNTVDNNTFDNCISAAVAHKNPGSESEFTTVTNNTISNTGLIIGAAKGTLNGFYSGISVGSTNSLIQYNTVTNSGYNGISSQYGDNSTIQFNVIDSSCLVLDDGGGIYTAGDVPGMLINSNIVSNTICYTLGSLASKTAVGIYLDEFADSVTVINNTVYNSPTGIFLHKALNCSILNNTIFNASIYGLSLNNSTTESSMSGNVIKNNTVVAKQSNQATFRFRSVLNDNYSFGVADSNYYARPIDDLYTITTSLPATGVIKRTLADWITVSTQDGNSLRSPYMVNSSDDLELFFNPKRTDSTIVLSDTYYDLNENEYTSSIQLQPFSSLFLMKNVSEPTYTDSIGNVTGVTGNGNTLNLRVIRQVMPRNGIIQSLSINHLGNSTGNIVMGLYSNLNSAPDTLIATTAIESISNSSGWQTLDLTVPASISQGDTIWFGAMFSATTQVLYGSNVNSKRAQSTATFANTSGILPDDFGAATLSDFIWYVYATYTYTEED